jgi:hypothetical protein
VIACKCGEGKAMNETRRETMSKYEARITQSRDGSIYALIVRIDKDGEENVIHGYKGRHFASIKAAERSTAKYIATL